MKVAWHEMPGMRKNKACVVGDGMIGEVNLVQRVRVVNKPASQIIPYPSGRVFPSQFPGISCLATFIESLRDAKIESHARREGCTPARQRYRASYGTGRNGIGRYR